MDPAARWLKSSNEERKALYKVTKEFADSIGLRLRDLCRAAFGNTGADEDNFRAGRIGKKNCVKLHRWMRANYPDFANRVEHGILGLEPLRKYNYRDDLRASADPWFRERRPGYELARILRYG